MRPHARGRRQSRAVVVAWLAAAVWLPADAAGQGRGAPTTVSRPDSALLRLSGPAGCPAPLAVRVAPDTVAFGGSVWIALDFATGADPPDADAVAAHGDGVVVPLSRRGAGAAARPRAEPPPAPAPGRRLLLAARALREGDLRVVWEGAASPPPALVKVRACLPDDAAAAPISPPRGLGWLWGRIAPLALAVALLAAAAAAWRRRRRGRRRPGDAPLPPPAYLETALACEQLLKEELAARGGRREYLDRLAGITRGHLRRRYGVPAAELTATEIESALLARGHAPAVARAWRDLLAAGDARRYAPEPPGVATCGEATGALVTLVAASRVPARFRPVPTELAVAGELAWERLARAFVRGERPVEERRV